MSEKIAHLRLLDFVEASKTSDFDFAQYTYDCGATKFVDQSYEFDSEKNKSIWTYEFVGFYLNPENFEFYPYFVVSFPGKSYLLYEIADEILVWVCFTKENHRGRGYMTELLKHLKGLYPEMQITVDTFNESLRKLCINNGINLFSR
jgi:hypothetical protein